MLLQDKQTLGVADMEDDSPNPAAGGGSTFGGTGKNPSIEITSDDESTDFEQSVIICKKQEFKKADKKDPAPNCIWCNRQVTLLPNTKHCQQCDAKCYRVCRGRCKRPFDSKSYFTLNDNRCDTCERAIVKDRLRREARKREQDGTYGDEEIAIIPAKKKRHALSAAFGPASSAARHQNDNEPISSSSRSGGGTSKIYSKSPKRPASAAQQQQQSASADAGVPSNNDENPFPNMKKRFVILPLYYIDD